MTKTEAQTLMTEMAAADRSNPGIGQSLGCMREVGEFRIYVVQGRWYINGKFHSKAKALAALTA